MGLRNWLKEGALAISLAGIIASSSCTTTSSKEYYWREVDVKTRIEKKVEDVLKYELVETSFSRKQKDSGPLYVCVIERLIKEYYENKITEREREKFAQDKEKTEFIGVGSLLSSLLNLALLPLIVLGKEKVGGTKIERGEPYRTGEKDILNTSESWFRKVNKVIKEPKPASHIPLKLHAEGLILDGEREDLETITEEDGTQTIEVKIPKEDRIFLDYEDIRNVDWKNIKDPAEPFIIQYLINNIKSEAKKYNIEIETNVKNAINNKKNIDITIKRWIVTDSLLNEAVKQFVSEKINDKIKYVAMSLLDYESHTSITLTKDVGESYEPGKIVLEPIKVPTKEDLIKPYFEGKLLQPALEALKDYITTKREVSTDTEKGEASFYIYIPSEFKVKITHPKYHHVSDQELNFSEKSLDKEVYMSKIGKKVDLKIVDKEPESKIKDKE